MDALSFAVLGFAAASSAAAVLALLFCGMDHYWGSLTPSQRWYARRFKGPWPKLSTWIHGVPPASSTDRVQADLDDDGPTAYEAACQRHKAISNLLDKKVQHAR